jgi:hypothetical protein
VIKNALFGSAARSPSARATGRSPSRIPMAMRGWFRRSRRGTPAESDSAHGVWSDSGAVRVLDPQANNRGDQDVHHARDGPRSQ